MNPAGTSEGILEQVEMTDVAGGLVDHVDKDPAEIHGATAKRRNRRDLIE